MFVSVRTKLRNIVMDLSVSMFGPYIYLFALSHLLVVQG